MFYGMYRDVRNSAWKCLVDFKIDRFPVDVMQITRQVGIRTVRDTVVRELLPHENGRAFFDGTNWIIIYNDRDQADLARYILAHELGHIFLGHDLRRPHVADPSRRFRQTSPSERQADRFALRLLCPACVLASLRLYSPEQIARCCRVDPELAEQRAHRIQSLYRRERFLHTPLERQLYEQFRPYVQTVLADGTLCSPADVP